MNTSAVAASNSLPARRASAEHLLQIGVGGHRVAGEPGEIGPQVRRSRQAQLVSGVAQRFGRCRRDGGGVLAPERVGMARQSNVLTFDPGAGVDTRKAQPVAHGHRAVGEHLGPIGCS